MKTQNYSVNCCWTCSESEPFKSTSIETESTISGLTDSVTGSGGDYVAQPYTA